MKFVDLFCGIGSFHYSFKKLGWECVMACDIDATARQTYALNYGIEPRGDICEIDPASVLSYDILCAGFPCQPFSQIGQQRGFDDERGTMFYQIMKFVEYHRPSFLLLENVPALLNHDNGNTFAQISQKITEKGYRLGYKILTCSDYGIPQNRKRLFIVGVKDHLNIDPNTVLNLTTSSKKTLSEYLGKPFERDVAFTLRCGGRSSPINDRHNWDGYWVNGEEYRLSIQDGLRLQGFDLNFRLSGSTVQQWKQIGNTIPTIFTELIGRNLASLLFDQIIG